ncbi:uncharacterized protein [Ptychodera flava]|uniref:uncharacterized protein n=1 Tax=Ptychodera flava TaxID=63121 RepID=UPI003969CAAA
MAEFSNKTMGHLNDELSESLRQVTLNDAERPGETDDDTQTSDEGGESLHRTLFAECEAYKEGTCAQGEICGRKQHHHVSFPSGSNWETHNMKRLRFKSIPLHIDINKPVVEIICSWLMDNGDIDDKHLPNYPATDKNDSSFAAGATTKAQYRQLLSRHIKEGIQGDYFMAIVFQFASKFDLEGDRMKRLLEAAATLDENDEYIKSNKKYQTVIINWLVTIKEHRNKTLCAAYIDHLAAHLIELAANETNCHVVTRIREATARTLTVCGQDITVQCDIEVQAIDGAHVLQVITTSENKVLKTQMDVEKMLPQITREALAVAPITPFGNDYYNTVYQISVHSVYCKEEKTTYCHIFLVKCYVSVNTLARMHRCPLETPFEPSYVMYQRVEGLQLQDPDFLLFVYQAFKAVMLAFKGVNLGEMSRRRLHRKK